MNLPGKLMPLIRSFSGRSAILFGFTKSSDRFEDVPVNNKKSVNLLFYSILSFDKREINFSLRIHKI